MFRLSPANRCYCLLPSDAASANPTPLVTAQVLSRFQVLAATFKALTLLLDGTLKTPNVHSEIVYSLGASNNVRIYATMSH